MLPEHFISKLHSKIKPEWKFTFLCTFGIGLLIHLYRLTNPLLTWDSLYNFHDPQNTIHLGRCFLTLVCGISSYYDLPTVNGLLSLCYIALTAVCLTEIFQLKSRLSLFCISGITVSFPAVASTLMYMYTADGYFLAMLLAAGAVLVTLKYRRGFLLGILLLCFSYGSYQAYISYAVMLILVWSLRQLLFSEDSLNLFFRQLLRFAIMGIGGTILYMICFKVLSLLEHTEASSYQGVSTMQIPGLSELLHAVPAMLTEFVYFFFGPLDSMNLFKLLNLLLFLVLFAAILCGMLRSRTAIKKPRLLLVLAVCVMLPFGCCMIYLVTPNVRYHMLMVMGFSLIYILPVLLADQLKKPLLSWAAVLLSIITIYNFALIDNITYLYAHQSYEETYALAVEMADRMEQTDGFDGVSRLCILGHFEGHDDIDIKLPPSMTGIKEGYIATEQNHFSAFFNTYLGFELEGCTEEEAAAIQSSPQSQSMGIWPAADSVRIEEDTVIIKIGGDS